MRYATARATLLLSIAGLLTCATAGCSDSPGVPDQGMAVDTLIPQPDAPAADLTPTADATSPGDATPPPVDTGGGDAVTGNCPAAGPTVVTFPTDDGVSLEADLYTAGEAGGPAAILLHMVPPSNDRTNFPAEFISALTERGFSVLNIDRRGAGGSGGEARDAYLGDKGKLDAKAARDYLAAHECGFDLSRLAIVGASNGTTTAVDYTVLTSQVDGLETPAALTFLTGGTYTEAQTVIDDQRGIFEAIPILFVFSTDERSWSVGYQPGAPEGWTFQEYDPGAHGVGMFDVQPGSIDVVADFLAGAVQ